MNLDNLTTIDDKLKVSHSLLDKIEDLEKINSTLLENIAYQTSFLSGIKVESPIMMGDPLFNQNAYISTPNFYHDRETHIYYQLDKIVYYEINNTSAGATEETIDETLVSAILTGLGITDSYDFVHFGEVTIYTNDTSGATIRIYLRKGQDPIDSPYAYLFPISFPHDKREWYLKMSDTIKTTTQQSAAAKFAYVKYKLYLYKKIDINQAIYYLTRTF